MECYGTFADEVFPRMRCQRALPFCFAVVAFCLSAAAQAPRDTLREPADYRSAHVLLHTDLAPDDARALLARFETILGLIAKYWGQPLAGELECYVVDQLDAWPAGVLSPLGRAKIANRSGVTTTQTISNRGRFIRGKSIVYATARDSTPQHEIVHAYCGQTFGGTGPLWYSEGMAELGQFWQEGQRGVQVKQHMVDYLHSLAALSAQEIVADDAADGEAKAGAQTGDSWQAYARRWALCHLLVNNENYAGRFRALGLNYLSGAKPRFEQVFAGQLDEIDFELREFTAHVEQGYRADLCRWDWQRKFQDAAKTQTSARILAQRGWQPSGAILKEGQQYAYAASGTWRSAADAEATKADGDFRGQGRLEGVVLSDFQLSEPFPLGENGTFTAPEDGRLYLRCRDDWNALADNSGFVNVKIRGAKGAKSRPELPAPADAR